MGSIKSLQISMGYGAPAPADMGHCEHCAHQTWADGGHGNRLPYCQMGGFFVWLDAGCIQNFSPRAGQTEAAK